MGDAGSTGQTGIPEAAQTFHQVLQARLLPGDPQDVLGGPRIALDDGHAAFSQSGRQFDASPGQALHARQQRGVHADPPLVKLAFRFPDDPVLLPPRVVVELRDPPRGKRQGRVDRHEEGLCGQGSLHQSGIRPDEDRLQLPSGHRRPSRFAFFAAGQIDPHDGEVIEPCGVVAQVREGQSRPDVAAVGGDRYDIRAVDTPLVRETDARSPEKTAVREGRRIPSLGDNPADHFLEQELHAFDVRVVVADQLAQGVQIAFLVVEPQGNGFGPGNAFERCFPGEAELPFDHLLPTGQADPFRQVAQIDVTQAGPALLEPPGQKRKVEQRSVERDDHGMLAQITCELLDPARVDQHRVGIVHGPAHQGDLIVVRAQPRAFDVEKYTTLREAGGNAVVLALRQPVREERDVAVGEGFLGRLHGRLQRAAALAVHVELDRGVADEIRPIRDAFRPEPRFLRYADSRKMLEGTTEQVGVGHGRSPPIGSRPGSRGAMAGSALAECGFSGVRQPGCLRRRPGCRIR